jgi:hypothetical protein
MKSQMRLTRTFGSEGGLGGRPPRSTRPSTAREVSIGPSNRQMSRPSELVARAVMVSLVAVCAAGGANEGRALSACGTSNFARGRSSIQRCIKRNDVLLRLDPEVAQKWSDLEVVRRWGRLCPIEGQSCQFRAKPCRDCDEIDRRNACLRSPVFAPRLRFASLRSPVFAPR